MTAGKVEAGLWAVFVTATSAAVFGWRAPVPAVDPIGLIRPLAPIATVIAVDSLDEAAAIAVESDPFRLERRPPSVTAQDALPVTAAQALQPPRASQITLAGIVGGPPWEALIEGFPDQPAPALVRAGNRVGDFHVRAVGRDTVVIQGPDSTWRLTLRKPWP